MSKYYGKKEIKDIVDTSTTSKKLKTLVFTDDSQIQLTDKMVSVAVTDVEKDLTTLRDLRCFPVVVEILTVLRDWNVNINEIDFITQRVIMSINKSYEKAQDILWGKSQMEQTMEDVNEVLLKEVPENKPEGIPSPYVPEIK